MDIATDLIEELAHYCEELGEPAPYFDIRQTHVELLFPVPLKQTRWYVRTYEHPHDIIGKGDTLVGALKQAINKKAREVKLAESRDV